MTLVLHYSPIEKVIRSTADTPGILLVLAGQDPDDPFEHSWCIDPGYQPPSSLHVESAQVIGRKGSNVLTTINGTPEEVRERITPVTVEDATAAADDLPTLQVMLAYAQSTLVSVVERYGSIHVYEAIIAVSEWCIEVRDAIASRLPDQQQPDQEEPSP